MHRTLLALALGLSTLAHAADDRSFSTKVHDAAHDTEHSLRRGARHAKSDTKRAARRARRKAHRINEDLRDRTR